jgi:hypothetical protein
MRAAIRRRVDVFPVLLPDGANAVGRDVELGLLVGLEAEQSQVERGHATVVGDGQHVVVPGLDRALAHRLGPVSREMGLRPPPGQKDRFTVPAMDAAYVTQ